MRKKKEFASSIRNVPTIVDRLGFLILTKSPKYFPELA